MVGKKNLLASFRLIVLQLDLRYSSRLASSPRRNRAWRKIKIFSISLWCLVKNSLFEVHLILFLIFNLILESSSSNRAAQSSTVKTKMYFFNFRFFLPFCRNAGLYREFFSEAPFSEIKIFHWKPSSECAKKLFQLLTSPGLKFLRKVF